MAYALQGPANRFDKSIVKEQNSTHGAGEEDRTLRSKQLQAVGTSREQKNRAGRTNSLGAGS
jgi:hypothetical protein